MPRPKLLIVAYAFPPHSVVGAQRPLRMVKYLPALTSWQTVVLSVDRRFARTDPSLLREIPAGTPVVRARSWEPYLWLERRRREAPDGGAAGGAGATPPTAPAAGRRTSPLRVLKRFCQDLLSTPDPQVGWVPAAVWRGLRLVREHRPEVILVTAPPWSALIIGWLLGALTRTPWIADYRDPWTDIDHGPQSGWRRRFERRLERFLVARAAAVLASSDRFAALLRARFPARDSADFSTLFNGFDEAKFSAPAPPRHERFTIAHLGSLYGLFKPEPVLAGLQRWLEREPARRPLVRLQFIGSLDDGLRTELARRGLHDVAEEVGFLPHAEAIAACRRAHVLLLAMGNTAMTPAGWMPSKLYEYLACRTPILAFTVRGEAAEAVERAGGGVVVDSDDPDRIADALETLYARRDGSAPTTAGGWPPALRRFTQGELIPGLAEILERTRRRRR